MSKFNFYIIELRSESLWARLALENHPGEGALLASLVQNAQK